MPILRATKFNTATRSRNGSNMLKLNNNSNGEARCGVSFPPQFFVAAGFEIFDLDGYICRAAY